MMPSFAHIPLMLAAGEAGGAGGGSRGFWRWLLGLHRIGPGDPGVVLGWRYVLPAWAWALVVLGIVGLAWISYRRLLGRKTGRAALAVVRGAILLVIVLLLVQPSLVLPREQVEEDQLLMLVDRSASLGIRDAIDPKTPTQRLTREQQLDHLLAANAPLWSQLARRHNVQWLGFDEQVQTLKDPANLGKPTGQATALRSALDEAIRRASGRPISGIVVWSDGRSTEPIGSETWQRLRQMGAPVFAVPLGSAHAPADLALERVDAPDAAFINDLVPVTVTVARTGDTASSETVAPPGTMVKLVDETTGRVLDSQPVTDLGKPVHLSTSSKAAGRFTWRVDLVTTQPELIDQNNHQSLPITLVDRPIRVLYVEGYPRWEYRYLKGVIVREHSVASSIMLLSADRTFAQEGTVPLRRLPRTLEEIKPYDVIVIGDVPASFFSSAELRLILDQVSSRGAGLLWIGGQQQTPASYAASVLSPLLPMMNPGSISRATPPLSLVPTPTAEALGVLHLRTPGEPPDRAIRWPTLPQLQWAQAVGPLKPAVEVLADDAKTKAPLVARMRFGAGQSVYVATDEIWRWRYGRGELYGEQFWMQLIRLLARDRLQSGSDQRAVLRASARRAAAGEALVVELDVHDQSMIEKLPATVDVAVSPILEGATQRADAAASQTLTLRPVADHPGVFRGTWLPRVAGKMALRVTSPSLADMGLGQDVTVDRSDDELRHPAANHELLTDLADHTGGAVLDPAHLDAMAKLLPDRARHTPADISEPLWNSPLAFAVLAILLSAEWIGRKWAGLA